jgi:hypothetical protein
MRFIDIHRDERLKVFLAWSLNGLLAAGHALGWAAVQAMLIKRVGVNYMPAAYILANFLGLMSSFFYLRLADAIRRDHALTRTAWLLGGLMVGAWMLIIGHVQKGVTPDLVLFLAMGVAAHGLSKSTLKAQTWTMFNDIFRPSQGRRVYPIIGTAKSLGGLAGGLLVAPLTYYFNLEACVLGWAISILLVVPMTWVIVHYFGVELQGGKARPHPHTHAAPHDERPPSLREGLKYCLQSRLVGLLAVMTIVFWVCNQIHDFQYTRIMSEVFGGEKQLGRWFGYYTAGYNVICLFAQFVVAPKLLGRLGVGRSLLLEPTAGLSGFAAVLASFTFWPGLYLRFSWDLIEDAFHQSAFQLAFNAVPAGWRGRARGFVDGIINPLGGMLGGLVIVVLEYFFSGETVPGGHPWGYHWLSVVGLLLCGLYLMVALRVRHAYVDAAIENLDHPDRRTLLDSVEALEERGHPGALAQLEAMAATGEIEVRRLALRCLARMHYATTFRHIEKLLDDPDPALRQTGLHVARSFHRSVARKHLKDWTELLRRAGDAVKRDAAPAVRAEAARLLLETADTPRATALIQDLLADPTEEVRLHVVETLAELRLPGLDDLLRPYLNDQRPAVRAATARALWRAVPWAQDAAETTLAALLASDAPEDVRAGLGAAARLPTHAFAPAFVELMSRSDPNLQALAAVAFMATGRSGDAVWGRAVDLLAAALTDPERELLLRAYLVPLYAELPADALDALLLAAAELSPEHRVQAAVVLHELYPALLKTITVA